MQKYIIIIISVCLDYEQEKSSAAVKLAILALSVD